MSVFARTPAIIPAVSLRQIYICLIIHREHSPSVCVCTAVRLELTKWVVTFLWQFQTPQLPASLDILTHLFLLPHANCTVQIKPRRDTRVDFQPDFLAVWQKFQRIPLLMFLHMEVASKTYVTREKEKIFASL